MKYPVFSLLLLVLLPWLCQAASAQLGMSEEEYNRVYGGLEGSDQKEAVIGRLRNESDVRKSVFLNASAASLGEATVLNTYKQSYKVAASQDQRRLALKWTYYSLKPGNYNVEIVYAYAEKAKQSATFKIKVGDDSFTWNSLTGDERQGIFRVDRPNAIFRLSGKVRVSIECLNSRKSGIMIAQLRLVPAGLSKNAVVLSGSQGQCENVILDHSYPLIDVARFREKGARITWKVRPSANKTAFYLLELEYDARYSSKGRKMILSVAGQKKRSWKWIALPTSPNYSDRIKTLPVEIVPLDPGLNKLSLQLDDEGESGSDSFSLYSLRLIPIGESDRNRLSRTRVRPLAPLSPNQPDTPATSKIKARTLFLPELLPVEKGIHQEIFASHKNSLTAKQQLLEKNFMAFLLKQRDAYAESKDFSSARETQAVIDLYTRRQRDVTSLQAPDTVSRAALAYNERDLQLQSQQKKLYEAELRAYQQTLATKDDYQGVADIQKHLELIVTLPRATCFHEELPYRGNPISACRASGSIEMRKEK